MSCVPIASGSAPGAGSVGDFDGDGAPDLISANRGDSTITVYFNAGGTLALGVSYSTVIEPMAVIAHDFDADGQDEAVVAGSSSRILPCSSGSRRPAADKLICDSFVIGTGV